MNSADFFGLPETVYRVAEARLFAEDPAARAAALAELLAEYPEHASTLRELCGALAGAENLLANAFAVPGGGLLPRLDGYRFVQQLGEGAFGVVYLCEQVAAIRRMVAVKVLRPGAGDRHTLARFEAERQFLARLNHPAIAQIFDAGLLPDGRPWFVMEHVAGAPITAYCDRAQLDVEARLELFEKLCHGVQHAHEHGIVHRDLKPANVLVVETGGQPLPKIIDFGIARALQPTGEPRAARTEAGRVIGTPGYMSPEQSDGQPDEVDARSDVFGLGVVLYELLTGELPWGPLPRSIDGEPQRPSQRIGSDPERSTTIAEERDSQPRRLATRLRGDLDWIVMKALQRSKMERYATAAELAAEIRRHLRGEPVHAGPPSLRYRLRKFVRRRRALVVVAAFAAAALLLAALLVRDYRSQAQARNDAAAAAIQRLLDRADDISVTSAPQSELVRRALAQEATRIYEQYLRSEPDAARWRAGWARSLCTLAQVHLQLGEFPEAERLTREVLERAGTDAADGANGGLPRDVVGLAGWFRGRALDALGRTAEATAELQRAREVLAACFAHHPKPNAARLVGVCRELVGRLDFAVDGEQAFALLDQARPAQQLLVDADPHSVAALEDLVQLDVIKSLVHIQRRELEPAMAVLAACRQRIDAASNVSFGTAARVHAAAMQAAMLAEDVDGTFAELGLAIDAARSWTQHEPNREQPRRMLAQLLTQQATLQQALGIADAAIASGRAAVATGELRLLRTHSDPEATMTLVEALVDLAKTLRDEEAAAAWREAEQCLRRAVEVAAAPDLQWSDEARLRTRWIATGSFATVANELGLDDADAAWRDTEQALRAWMAGNEVGHELAVRFVAVATALARHLLANGRLDPAEHLLGAARRTFELPQPAGPWHVDPDVFDLSARIAAQRREPDIAAEFAERAHDVDGTWRGWCAAARAMDAVRAVADVAARPAYEERAIALHTGAVDALRAAATDRAKPSLTARLAQAQLRLALAQRAHGQPFDPRAVDQAIATLTAERDRPHHYEWDPRLLELGAALAAK